MKDDRPPPHWLLPLSVAVLPLLVTHLALWLSIQAGHVPACLPYLEGCTSISRAARHGLANTLFQAVMLPVALLHALNWWQTRRWLGASHRNPRAGASLLPLGLIASLALAVYALALGTEGDFYRWMRRFGIIFYFGCSYLAQLVATQRMSQLGVVILPPGMRAIGLALLLIGLASTAISNGIDDALLKDGLENLLEWHVALLMTLWFALQAWVYRGLRGR